MAPKRKIKDVDEHSLVGEDKISIRGAKTHNLKNVSLEIPRNKMVVFTGLSGSGKSSLAFDTIFAEGQRRYVESLSAYARQFLNQMQKPDVEEITGLSPAISIDQKSRSNNPRSTVATITEIYDYMRILYARVGQPYCIHHDVPIEKLSKEEILKIILKNIEGVDLKQTAKTVKGVKYNDLKIAILAPLVVGRKGEYYQMLYDLLGKGYAKVIVDGKEHSLRDRIILEKNKRHDIDVVVDEIFLTEFATSKADALERLSEAVEKALEESKGLIKVVNSQKETQLLSAKFICPQDGSSFPEVEPRLFSFNSPYGACPECNGLGTIGFFNLDECPVCNGNRLRPEALRVFLRSDAGLATPEMGLNIVELTNLSIVDAQDYILGLTLSKKQKEISGAIVKEILNRLQFMIDVGIGYLSLNRTANTLSGGEAQRIRLASQLGSGLVGALYVLDEPTIGLHQKDNARLIQTLTALRDLGNTIIVVEHDEDTIYASDFIVDIGPGAGVHGGEIVVAGWLDKLLSAKNNESNSTTLGYLRGEKSIPVPETRRTQDKGTLKLRNGEIFNISKMDVDVPLGRFVAVTGVSGSGKSSFVYELLYKNLRARLERRYRTAKTYNASSFTGTEYLSRIVLIDQSPIGRTPRSNPATYTGAFTHIRDLFAATNEARARGWKGGRFSFNVKGGRCETCQGNGTIAVEMHFLPTVYVECDVCGGKRFMKETLEILYKGKNIYDVLSMTVEEALQFFNEIPAIYDRLKTLSDVGLGYVTLGQSATTLSGGEAQRVKISSELYRRHTEKTIYLLDEPTIGLHYDDVRKLIDILQTLVDKGNTLVVIEHNLDLIKCADYIIDMGPEGGVGGGKIVAKGTPEEVARTKGSFTGEYLKKIL
ncbi:excinuclease ABC subunit A [Candidatus Kaiserbacteria bacterium CG10_big_fil_rev_8_21_14_0_10_45_20]|uniref:UvrABC system protein A n=1 Tax=Candidatus Kaiserbacteria bacterium CG10_big_fil_rev_8_21_14_0_10_45_20 TaxID=1974607 RepID=A0A2H0UEY9_9BACT|nr:MAG: excinuclease ABC subunit A [Candidatus Kaiserbacteria bacterium CG10_big_fil_rev_8_21_14_0_10_45_20]